jgi:hypothetical protein
LEHLGTSNPTEKFCTQKTSLQISGSYRGTWNGDEVQCKKVEKKHADGAM